MLKKFIVKNFKGFKEPIVLDLTSGQYNFNSNLIKDGIVNKAIIYGKNGTGKSNLGLAIFDISSNLTENIKPDDRKVRNFLNYESSSKYAIFEYHFVFDGHEVNYIYAKANANVILCEELIFDDVSVLYHSLFQDDIRKNYCLIDGANNLILDYSDASLSAVKYVYRSIPKDEDSLLSKLMNFVSNMLWFRCLIEGNDFIGFKSSGDDLNNIIIKANKVEEFESFLKDNELNYKLIVKNVGNTPIIHAKFKNAEVPLFDIASSGTRSLWLYFCWAINFEKLSFVFIDEFDAFYHFETSEYIVKAINHISNCQTILTSHNTYLMKNSITRPDSCFILSEGKIHSLANCTDKEIREAHNLEKMYRNGAFTQ